MIFTRLDTNFITETETDISDTDQETLLRLLSTIRANRYERAHRSQTPTFRTRVLMYVCLEGAYSVRGMMDGDES